jgi:chromosome segregation ATPase
LDHPPPKHETAENTRSLESDIIDRDLQNKHLQQQLSEKATQLSSAEHDRDRYSGECSLLDIENTRLRMEVTRYSAENDQLRSNSAASMSTRTEKRAISTSNLPRKSVPFNDKIQDSIQEGRDIDGGFSKRSQTPESQMTIGSK